ncbi:elongator complex protein 6-like [Aplysia californica]|uniref:Elongator complex protein 6 n=1 Tax=Aplysia californica TaxID=6500 RepID=A0ABM0K4F3_APLCA|nr:elongator complex protein 6-like [Aplysia californica]
MLAQICQFLAVDSSYFPQNEHIIIGDRSNEGCFLVHYFLNLCEKQNRPVCVIGLSQSFHHYNTVAHKLGTNLLSACDENKNLHFIEGLKLLGGCFDVVSTDSDISKPFLEFVNGISTPLLQYIQSSVDKLTQIECPVDNVHGPVVIVDDLSVLLTAGASAKDIILLLNGLRRIVSSQKVKGSLITFSSLEKEDEEIEEVWAYMSHISTLKIEVSALSSGFCKDVHGQMKIEWQDSCTKPRKSNSKHTQFKLSDKSVDLFASGMSAAVL